MSILKLDEFLATRKKDYYGINVYTRFDAMPDDDWYGFQLDVQCMPVCCNHCNNTLSDLYCHCGSRYGQVGTIVCNKCGCEIYVTDHDNIVESIRFNKEEFMFNELYKMHWKYLSQLEKNMNISILNLFGSKNRISINDVLKRLQNQMQIQISGKYQYITNERFNKLPEEVNNWLELLDICNVRGIYISKRLV